jgi:hypothetical protein
VPDTTARRRDPAREDAAPDAGVAGRVQVLEPAGTAARYRVRRASARPRAVKVLYGEDELATVAQAAARAGLRPSSYVAAAALAAAQGAAAPASSSEFRELLTELMRTRAAVRQYGTNLNQVAAALNSGASEVPVWLRAAVAGADRATARIDEAAAQLRRRLA